MQLTLRGKSTTQSYRQPVYYVDITLRDGVSLNDAIAQAQQIDQQCKAAGFSQEALDLTAQQGFANARFETDMEDGLDVVQEFYSDQSQNQTQQHQQTHDLNQVQELQQGLQQSVRAVN